MSPELIVGFSPTENEKIKTHLERLLPYFRTNDFVIVGGLAIRHHLITHGISYPPRPFNDLDIYSTDPLNIVDPRVSQDFLIYHVHPEGNYLALVDPVSKTKVDIFRDYIPEQLVEVSFEEKALKIQGIEDQLVKTIFDLQRISQEKKVDPKQFSDAEFLMRIADLSLANDIWKRKNFQNLPTNIRDAFDRANKIASEHPEWLQEKPFRKLKPYKCEHCQNTKNFKITPTEEIYKLLGYIE